MKCQTMWCHQHNGRFFNFSQHPRTCRMHDRALPVFQVLVVELPAAADDCCWAWWNNEQQVFTMVYPYRQALKMCFPYGPEIEERQGRGLVLPVSVEVVQEVVFE